MQWWILPAFENEIPSLGTSKDRWVTPIELNVIFRIAGTSVHVMRIDSRICIYPFSDIGAVKKTVTAGKIPKERSIHDPRRRWQTLLEWDAPCWCQPNSFERIKKSTRDRWLYSNEVRTQGKHKDAEQNELLGISAPSWNQTTINEEHLKAAITAAGIYASKVMFGDDISEIGQRKQF